MNIIGDGSYLNELKEIVGNENIANVNFTGRIPLAEMSDYYQASDVLIISLKNVPLYEIMIPSKFQAYLTTQKPIFAIFNGEVRKMVEQYQIGYGAAPDDIEDIAKVFSTFLKLSTDEKRIMSESAASLLNSTFNKKQIVEKINSRIWS